jgi:SAM-dependent methyltransferase
MANDSKSSTDMSVARFFDTRSAYMMFSTATNEKPVVAARIGDESRHVHPGPRALRVLDAGMGDGKVVTEVMRGLHRRFQHVPWLIIAKEISIEDVRLALDKMADRFVEHPELVFAVTNMSNRETPRLAPAGKDGAQTMSWRSIGLEGTTASDFSAQIRGLFPLLVEDWAVRTSPKTGNPLYVRPSVLILYRTDREFLLDPIIPRRGETDGVFDLVIASQPYRARTSDDHKMRMVLVPLARALAPGGRLVGVHAHGDDPGLEIIRGVWPEEDPFHTSRHTLERAAHRHFTMPDDRALRFLAQTDEEAIFRYQLHAMPSEVSEHIGTSLIMAAWNAATYVAQVDEQRMVSAMSSGAYVEATHRVIQCHGGVWFNDEAFVISRQG